MPAMLSGSTARFRHRYLREELGERAWEAALNQLTDNEREQIALSEHGSRLFTSTEGRLVDTLVTHRFGPDRMSAETFLRRGGGMQADEMLDGVFKVFARFVTPDQAVARGPAILGAAYSGIDVTVDSRDHSGTLTIAGLGDYPYAAPWICGWMEHAIERFGGAKAHVDEKSWLGGSKVATRLEFAIRWE